MNKKVTDKVLYLLQKKFNREEFKKNVTTGGFSLISTKFPNENEAIALRNQINLFLKNNKNKIDTKKKYKKTQIPNKIREQIFLRDFDPWYEGCKKLCQSCICAYCPKKITPFSMECEVSNNACKIICTDCFKEHVDKNKQDEYLKSKGHLYDSTLKEYCWKYLLWNRRNNQ